MAEMWRAVSDRPPLDEGPRRHWIYVEGERVHSGGCWLRQNVGVANVDPNGPQGYRAEDLAAIAADPWTDMDPGTMHVVAWMPCRLPAYPTPAEACALREIANG